MKNRERLHFTLLEMLVVVGIMAILMSILLPALGMAKRTAKGIQCLNTLKQMGAGFAMYVDDYYNLPMAYTWTSSWVSLASWDNAVGEEVGLKRSDPVRWDTVTGLRGDWICPEAKTQGVTSSGYAYDIASKILYAYQLNGYFGQISTRYSKIKNLSSLSLVAEGRPSTGVFGYSSVPTELDNRHGAISNVLYADFHVGSIDARNVNWNDLVNWRYFTYPQL